MTKEERVAKWILRAMIFFVVVCSMYFSAVILYTQSNSKREQIKTQSNAKREPITNIQVGTIRLVSLPSQPENNKKEPVKIAISYPPLYLTTKSSGPHTWEYYIWLYKGNCEPIKKGAALSISGDGITSASVVGEALSDEFGAWQVKEIKNNCVIFEATKDANLARSFEGFSITAARATGQIETNWWFTFEPFEINGKQIPVSFTQGTAWGPE